MHFFDALSRLNDLPATFRRPDLAYNQLMSSVAAALTLLTEADTALLNQTDYNNSTAGWIDVWGDLPGILRRAGEADDTFHARLPAMLLAWRDSAVAIQTWLRTVENTASIVVENLPVLGYKISVPATLPPATIDQIIKELAYVRPAGVPFNFYVQTGGTFLGTVDYYGATISKTEIALLPGPAVIGSLGVATQPVSTGWAFGGRVTGAYLSKGLSPGKTFLGTVNYYGARRYLQQRPVYSGPIPIIALVRLPWQGGRVTGSYLASTSQSGAPKVPAATNNQLSALPDLLLTDPTLNP